MLHSEGDIAITLELVDSGGEPVTQYRDLTSPSSTFMTASSDAIYHIHRRFISAPAGRKFRIRQRFNENFNIFSAKGLKLVTSIGHDEPDEDVTDFTQASWLDKSQLYDEQSVEEFRIWQEGEEIQGNAFRMPEATDVSTLAHLPTEAVGMYRAPQGSIALFVVRGRLAGDPGCDDPEPADRPLGPTDPPDEDWHDLSSNVIRWEWFEDLRSENGVPIVFLFVNVASDDLAKLGLTPLRDDPEVQRVTQQQRRERVDERSRKRARYHYDEFTAGSCVGRRRANRYWKRDAEDDEVDEDDEDDDEDDLKEYEDDEAEKSHAPVPHTSLNRVRKPERRSGRQAGQRQTTPSESQATQQQATPAPSVSSARRPTAPRRPTPKSNQDMATGPPAPALAPKSPTTTHAPGRPTSTEHPDIKTEDDDPGFLITDARPALRPTEPLPHTATVDIGGMSRARLKLLQREIDADLRIRLHGRGRHYEDMVILRLERKRLEIEVVLMEGGSAS
ncbi:hypothetical protein Tdes44962_MAKER00242 [Teratosphaeria destructans]|uniref:Uncharacterized protein n=1 Tax=Teratosphaeria destructans TaxID=418781 RepID=A0A9W7SW18_9PEZI|nr:hypothetical protein Tdes44962_MAKER00242 [Teratosphaeria destructans]